MYSGHGGTKDNIVLAIKDFWKIFLMNRKERKCLRMSAMWFSRYKLRWDGRGVVNWSHSVCDGLAFYLSL